MLFMLGSVRTGVAYLKVRKNWCLVLRRCYKVHEKWCLAYLAMLLGLQELLLALTCGVKIWR